MSIRSRREYDLVIVGGGAAGFAAALRAHDLGFRSVMINHGLPMGGTCVNVGCVPTKFLLEVANEYYYREHPHFACNLGAGPRCDFPEAIRNKDRVVEKLRQSNYQDIVSEYDLEYREGRAALSGARKVRVNGETLQGKNILIGTGVSPSPPQIGGLDESRYLTHVSLMSQTERPDELMVLGGGALGLEFAQMYAHFGTRVTVLESSDRVLATEEPEVSEEIAKQLIREGIIIHTGARVNELKQEAGHVVCRISGRPGFITCEADKVLLATGMVPNTADLRLHEAGVALTDQGYVRTDRYLRTTAPSVWAAGDVTGHTGLETVAAKEGATAATNALKRQKGTIDYDLVPHAVFTNPQVASVGLTEAEMDRRGVACECRTVPMTQVPKALTVGDTRGLLKMVVEAKSKRLRGIHIVSPLAADAIHAAVYALRARFTIDDIIDTVHTFPTFSEALKIAAQSFYRDMSHVSCCIE